VQINGRKKRDVYVCVVCERSELPRFLLFRVLTIFFSAKLLRDFSLASGALWENKLLRVVQKRLRKETETETEKKKERQRQKKTRRHPPLALAGFGGEKRERERCVIIQRRW